MVETKVPNNDNDSEMSVLGAILLDNEVYHKLNLSVDSFYQRKHQTIWKAIKHKLDKGEPVDLTTLGAKLRKDNKIDGVGGTFYLIELTKMPAHGVEHYAQILTKCLLKRQLLSLASKIKKDVFSGELSTSEVIAETYSQLDLLSKDTTNQEFQHGGEVIADMFSKMEDNSEEITGQKTGFKKLDYVIGGLAPCKLYTLAASTGVGKSAMMVSFLSKLIERGNKPAVFALEMDNVEVMQRLLAVNAKIEMRRLKSGDMNESEWKKLNKSVANVTNNELYLNDNPYITLSKLMAQARKLVRDKGADSIWVDHIGIMSRDRGFEGKEHEWLKHVSDSLKRLAKELKVPVIQLSQLKWKEYSDSDQPRMSDIHGSKGIGEASNAVFILHRELKDNPEERQDSLFKIVKHRGGPTGVIRMKFVGALTKYVEE